MFEFLVEYKHQHGHVNVPQLYRIQSDEDDTHKGGSIPLGSWVANHRKAYEYTTVTKIQQQQQQQQEVQNQPKKDQHNDQDNDKDTQQQQSTPPQPIMKGFANKTKKGKKNHTKLSPERIAKLESVGFVWKLRHGRPKRGDERFRNKLLGILK